MRSGRTAPALAGALLAGLIGACSERGDFGRPRPSVLAESARAVGTRVAAWRGEPASDLPLTDDETELHRRAWRFLMPSENQDSFEQALSDAVRVRLLPAAAHPADPDAYHSGLVAGPYGSPASRFRRLGEDAAADAALVAPFAALSLRVVEADRVRLAMLERARPLRPDEAEAALARVAENRCLMAWVRRAAAGRALAYRAALDRLAVEAPQGEAVGAERALAELDVRRRVLDAMPASETAAGCAGEVGVAPPTPLPLPGSIAAKG